MKMIDYKQVTFDSGLYHQLLTLRDTVLRRPIGMVLRPKDTVNDAHIYHFAAMDQNKAIGCVLLEPKSETIIELRQMAILDTYQGKNIGIGLVNYAESFAKSQNFTMIETRARKVVEGFYLKLGYQTFKNEFEDKHTFLMRKSI